MKKAVMLALALCAALALAAPALADVAYEPTLREAGWLPWLIAGLAVVAAVILVALVFRRGRERK